VPFGIERRLPLVAPLVPPFVLRRYEGSKGIQMLGGERVRWLVFEYLVEVVIFAGADISRGKCVQI
jgi:hypothetical protein